MHRTLRSLLIGLSTLGMVGCADAMRVSAPSHSPASVESYSQCGDGSYPCIPQGEVAGVYPKILRMSPVVYWEDSRSNSSTALSYYGNCYRIDLKVTISGPSGSSSHDAPTHGCSSFLPADHNVSTAGFLVGVNGSCGHVANLAATHRAYTRIFVEWNGFTQFEAVGSRSDTEEQPVCCPAVGEEGGEIQHSLAPGTSDDVSTTTSCSGDSGGGGPGGEIPPTYRCYTFTVDHYWYYPETGRVEYRYTTETTWCEQSA